MNWDLHKRIAIWLEEAKAIKAELPTEGQNLVGNACGPCGIMTLRQLARETGLSATYLSRVMSGDVVISPGAYLMVCNAATIRRAVEAGRESKWSTSMT